MVGGVIVGEDGPVLGENVKEMNSTDLNGPTEVVVGWRGGGQQHNIRACMKVEEGAYCNRFHDTLKTHALVLVFM